MLKEKEFDSLAKSKIGYMSTAGIAVLLLTVSMAVMTPAALAISPTITDATGDAENNDPNFDITSAGITDKNILSMTVAGKAGGTTPSDPSQANLVYAYVFITDVGVIAVTSHQAEDSGQVKNDLKWHAHLVTLDNGCVTSIEDFGKAKLRDSRIDVSQTGATSVSQVLTAELTISDSTVCVTQVWDSAS
jgi:hypothetical protein